MCFCVCNKTLFPEIDVTTDVKNAFFYSVLQFAVFFLFGLHILPTSFS